PSGDQAVRRPRGSTLYALIRGRLSPALLSAPLRRPQSTDNGASVSAREAALRAFITLSGYTGRQPSHAGGVSSARDARKQATADAAFSSRKNPRPFTAPGPSVDRTCPYGRKADRP